MKRLQVVWLCACTKVAPTPAPTEPPTRPETAAPARSTAQLLEHGETEQLHAHAEERCKVSVTRWPAFQRAPDWKAAVGLATREIAGHLSVPHHGRAALCPDCVTAEPHAYAFPDSDVDIAGMDVRVGGFVVPQADGRVDVLPLAFQMRMWHCGPEIEAHVMGPRHARLVEALQRDEGVRFGADDGEVPCEPGEDDCSIGCFFSETRVFDLLARPEGPLLVERTWAGGPDEERVQLDTTAGGLVIRGCGPVFAL